MSKILIGNASVIDGSGTPRFPGWVLIENERIQTVSRTPLNGEDARFVNADGLILAPGFIDAHAHSDLSLIAEPEAEGKISQGITSEISGNCGLSAFPVQTPEVRSHLEKLYRIYEVPLTWHDFSSYTDAVAAAHPAVNAGFLCGHNTLRANVFGYAPAGGTPEEWHRERELLRESLEQGALGLSSGLLYTPGKFAPPEELHIIASALRDFDAPYVTHLRSEGDRLLESVEEAMNIARAGSGRLHLSHLKTAQPRNWHKIDGLLNKIAAAQTGGLRVTADRYPYRYGQTSLSVILPPPYDSMTDTAIQQALSASPAECRRIAKVLAGMTIDWQKIILCSTGLPGMMCYAGRTLAEIAGLLQRPAPELCTEWLSRDAVGTMAAFGGLSPENLRRIILQDYTCCGTDETARPCSERIGRSHPRGFGSFPRFIRLCRQAGQPLETVIARLTSLPARIFSLPDRGMIRAGFYADLILFSESELSDRADFRTPHAVSSGLHSVYVNGTLSFSGGRICARQGKILKKC